MMTLNTYFWKIFFKADFKNSLSTLLNNYQKLKHRNGSEVLILGKYKHFQEKNLEKEIKQEKPLNKNKTELSSEHPQCHWNTSPFISTIP